MVVEHDPGLVAVKVDPDVVAAVFGDDTGRAVNRDADGDIVTSGGTADSRTKAVASSVTWTPGEAQGPGDYTVTVRVTDNGTPALDDSVRTTSPTARRTPP